MSELTKLMDPQLQLDPEKLERTIALVREMQKLRARQAELIEELLQGLQVRLAIAKAFPDVTDNTIKTYGYRPPTQNQYKRWSLLSKLRLPWNSCTNSNNSQDYRGRLVVTYAKKFDGTELEFPDPLFLDGAPWGNVRYHWHRSDKLDSLIDEATQAEWMVLDNLNSKEDLDELRRRNQEKGSY